MKGKQYSQIILITLIVVLAYSCSDSSCTKLQSYLEENCDDELEECQINLKEVYSFPWDSMFIFDEMMHPDEVAVALGFDCKCKQVSDGKKLILFTYMGEIVKGEEIQCFNISFNSLRNNGVVKINASNSKFKVKVKVINGQTNYYF